jgi:heme/copper-type cytochrome/quinol oxidase subunit 3
MDIPYTVHARPDTGLYNAKVGIWLFLASEVMLFGGLFSSYIFLRLGADYPWPIHELSWGLGFVNTVVLIASSVTVVWAWAAAKMRQFARCQLLLAITVLCAAVFMVNKTLEYKAKFDHYSVTLTDGSILSGHLEHGYHITFEASELKFNISGMHRAVDADPEDYVFPHVESESEGKLDGVFKVLPYPVLKSGKIPASPDLSSLKNKWEPTLFAEIRKLSVQAANQAFEEIKKEGIEIAEKALKAAQEKSGEDRDQAVLAAEAELTKARRFNQVPDTVITFTPTAPIKFVFGKTDVFTYTADSAVFRDGTSVTGKLIDDKITLTADALDLRSVPAANRENSIAFDARYLGEEWKKHYIQNRDKEIHEFNEKYSDGKGGTTRDPAKSATFQKHAFGLHIEHQHPPAADAKPGEHGGAETDAHGTDAGHGAKVVIETKDVTFFSNYTPKLNTYYAIYFTLTGLHGLHVIAGALVLLYFLVFNGKMMREDTEHFANRVEVGGLFWHFVDLVWIFLFPLLYLL